MTALRLYKGAVQPPVKGWDVDYITENWIEDELANFLTGFIDSTLEVNDGTAPDGSSDAIAVQCTAQAGVQTPYAQRAVWNLESDKVYTFSAYVQKDSIQYAFIQIFSYGTGSATALYDLDDSGNVTGLTGGIDAGAYLSTDDLHGYPTATTWLRIYVTFDTFGDNSGNIRLGLSELSTIHRVTDPTTADRIRYWGGMINEGYLPKPFLPTSGSVITDRRIRTEASSPWTPSDPVTNYVPFSDPEETGWNRVNTVVSGGINLLPKTPNLRKIADNASGGTKNVYINDNATFPLSTEVCLSCYATAGSVDWVYLAVTSLGSLVLQMGFDVNNGVVGVNPTADVSDYGIISLGNGLYRPYIVFTTDASDALGNVRVYIDDVDTAFTPSVVADGSNDLYVGGVQINEGNYPATLVPNDTNAAKTSAAPNNVIYLYKGAVQPTKFPSAGFGMGSGLIGGRRIHDWRGASPTGWPEITRGRPA